MRGHAIAKGVVARAVLGVVVRSVRLLLATRLRGVDLLLVLGVERLLVSGGLLLHAVRECLARKTGIPALGTRLSACCPALACLFPGDARDAVAEALVVLRVADSQEVLVGRRDGALLLALSLRSLLVGLRHAERRGWHHKHAGQNDGESCLLHPSLPLCV